MKFSFAISLAFFFNACLCQTGRIQVVVTKPDSSNMDDPVIVGLMLGTREILSDHQLFNKSFSFEHLTPGFYKITCYKIGYRLEWYDSIQVRDSQTVNLTIPYPGPCRFVYDDTYIAKCPYGHSDHIIPIVYGLPTKRTMNKSKKGKVHLGGCMVTDCDPRYYCTLHDREF